MSGPDASQEEMRRLLLGEHGADPPALDGETADRLLAGRSDPADAPPGYAEVAMVLMAAASPPTPGELAGEAAAIATFAAAQRPSAGSRRRTGGRHRASGSRLVALATAAVCVLSAGVAAAATGTLPAPARWVVDSVSRAAHHFPARSVGERQDQGTVRSGGTGRDGAVIVGHAGSGQGAHVDRSAPTAPTGPGATGAARSGQCAPRLAARAGVSGCADDARRELDKAEPERRATPQPRGQGMAPQQQQPPQQPSLSVSGASDRQKESGQPGATGARR